MMPLPLRLATPFKMTQVDEQCSAVSDKISIQPVDEGTSSLFNFFALEDTVIHQSTESAQIYAPQNSTATSATRLLAVGRLAGLLTTMRSSTSIAKVSNLGK